MGRRGAATGAVGAAVGRDRPKCTAKRRAPTGLFWGSLPMLRRGENGSGVGQPWVSRGSGVGQAWVRRGSAVGQP